MIKNQTLQSGAFAKKALVSLLSLCSAPALLAQTLVDPDYGVAELKYLQAEDGSDGAEVQQVIHQVEHTVLAGQDLFIPLGEFSYGELHKLEVSIAGGALHGAAELAFSSDVNGGELHVLTEKKQVAQGEFEVLYAAGQNGGVLIVLHCVNSSGAGSQVRVNCVSPRKSSWSFVTPTAAQVTALVPVAPVLQLKADGSVKMGKAQGDISMGAFSGSE